MMASREENLCILFVLCFQLAILSLSTSLPTKAVLSYPWDDDDDDFNWFRRSTTRTTYYWERRTTPYDDYKYKSHSSSTDPMLWAILGGGVFVGLLIYFIKYLCSIQEESTYESMPTLHPPPSTVIRPPNAATQPTQNRPEPQNARNFSTPYGVGIFDTASLDYAGVWRPGDRPPGYSEVVMDDFSDGNTKFPEVAPKPIETPPPKYDFGNLPKY